LNVFERLSLYGHAKGKRNRPRSKQRRKFKEQREKERKATLDIGLDLCLDQEKIKRYQKKLIENQTTSEYAFIRMANRTKDLRGKFQAQVPYSGYILDFFYPEFLLAIEIDGSSHDNKRSYDYKRDKCLEAFGLTILRFTNDMIWNNFKMVRHEIRSEISKIIQKRNSVKLQNIYCFPAPCKTYFSGEMTQEQLIALVPSLRRNGGTIHKVEGE
jgi:very-short-patch-repair endonuclease